MTLGRVVDQYAEEDGKIYDRISNPDYIEWLKTFRQAYQEGLIGIDYLVDSDDQVTEKSNNGAYFCMLREWSGMQEANAILASSENPDSYYIAIDGPANSNGDAPLIFPGSLDGWMSTFISKDCKDPARAIAFLTYMLSEEGQKDIFLGVEGETYEVVDGKPQLTDEMIELMNSDPNTFATQYGLVDTYWMLRNSVIVDQRRPASPYYITAMSDWADKIAAMSLDAYYGLTAPFTDAVHQVRPHKGQIVTAARMRELLKGSEIVEKPKSYVQDPYSFRCIPQVHGTVKDTIAYVDSVIDVEVNSATDNPTVCPDEDLIISAGNFHGEPIAMPMDFLSIAMCELSNISERRIYKLISGTRGLPSFLVASPGLNSGFMIPQYTAASVVSLNKSLATPSSVDSIPSSQGQEDHVSMGANAAIKLYKVVLNTERVLAIELFNAAQALEFRRPLKSSPAVEAIFEDYRKVVPFIVRDEVMYPHIANSIEFLRK